MVIVGVRGLYSIYGRVDALSVLSVNQGVLNGVAPNLVGVIPLGKR
jgi:hypothetical protein